MAKKNTGGTAKKFIKPNAIVVTEFAGTETTGAPTGDTYVLEDVVRDTTSIAQDDNETTDIECETSDSPIYTAVTLGKYQFSAEVGDVQDDLLTALLGFTKDGNKLMAPSSYGTKYVQVAVCYKNKGAEDYTAFVVPRLQLNSKMTIESLNTNLARITLSGTANDWEIATDKRTPFYVDSKFTIPTGA